MSLLEVVVVAAIIGALLGIAFTSMGSWQTNERASAAARSMGDLFRFASAEATSKETVHLLFFAIGGNGDTAGTALVDSAGNPVPVLLLDDGALGSPNQNCEIDPGEEVHVLAPAAGVGWGFALSAGAKAPGDATAIASTTGFEFRDAGRSSLDLARIHARWAAPCIRCRLLDGSARQRQWSGLHHERST